MSNIKISKVNNLLGIEYQGERIVNLCPHPIRIVSPWKKDEIITIPQSGNVARTNKEQSDVEKHAGFTIKREIYGDVYGLPEEVDGTIYIVSSRVLKVLNNSRKDVVSIGKQIRDPMGKTILTISFRR